VVLLVAAAVAILGLTLIQVEKVPVYLTADGGHYLADADAVFGNGVRELRHLPAFPLVLASVGLFAGDLLAIRIAMALVMAGLMAAFFFFVRGRTGSRLAEATGTIVFVLAPVYAEAVGWYGMATLLGGALSLVAMRLIDDSMAEPSARRIIATGIVCGVVGLTHPHSFVLLFEITVLSLTIVALAAARARRGTRFWTGYEARRRVLAAAGIAVVTAATVLPGAAFYAALRNPQTIEVDLGRLSLVWDWAFRDGKVLWLGLLASLVLSMPVAKRLRGGSGVRLVVWAGAAAVVVVANLVGLGGHPSYTTRSLYLLPVAPAVAAAVLVAAIVRATSRRSHTGGFVLLVGPLVAVAFVAWAASAYSTRLGAAIPFYNTVTEAEWDGMERLTGISGTAVVATKPGDPNAGTYYAWMIEGIADVAAAGPSEPWLHLLEGPRRASLEAERLVSGSHGIETPSLRVAVTEGTSEPIAVYGRGEGSWNLLAEVTLRGPGGQPTALREVAIDHGSGALTIFADAGGTVTLGLGIGTAELHVSVPAGASAPLQDLVVAPSESTTSMTILADGAHIAQQVTGRSIDMQLDGVEGLDLDAGRDPDNGLPTLVATAEEGSAITLRISVSGTDGPDGPIRTFVDTDSAQALDVASVFAWLSSRTAARLFADECYEAVFTNAEVVIFERSHICERIGRGGSTR
jgi:hypothetical protein